MRIEEANLKALRIVRAESGMTLEELAEKSGIALNTVSRIERGLQEPRANTLHKLAEALDVPVAAFFRDEPEYTYPPKADDPVGLPIRTRWLPSTLSEAALPSGSFLLEQTGHAYFDWRVSDLNDEAESLSEPDLLALLRALEAEERVLREELGQKYRGRRKSREYRSRIRQLQHLFTERIVALAEIARAVSVVAEAERILEEAHARA